VETEKPGLMGRLFNSNSSKTENITSKSESITDNTVEHQLDTYKNCLIELLNKLDNANSPNGKLAALKISARDAQHKSELDKLSDQLSIILQEHSKSDNHLDEITDTIHKVEIDTALQPSIQELLIRLLEQLIVPADLQDEADKMKHRLEQETDPTNWKQLLKDVAQLINSIRSRLQKEKHEFEDFLQQVTDRLKAMDHFLQNETSNIIKAESQGQEFDKTVDISVAEIRQNINTATEISSLKDNVNSKLDTISGHIKLYRESEKIRFENSQKEVEAMHSKMQALESEADKLKKVVIEKNKQAMFDTLTGIPNRLSYEKKAAEEIARWKRFSNPLSLAIWDIDLFKHVNDTYGHKAGDKVLKTVAQLLVKSIRETDFLARYGGEEFVMLLPGTKQEETLRLVNKLRKQIEDCGFHYHGESVQITISCGVSSFNENDSLSQVFERADKALYKAKENGRNQCVVASCLSD
ncbi:MAG: diguanylate cyclase, partial [Gammaproteobacteria bacterium]|nr:diguanylate cyclase [Gammaproteobacteria bacterium]